MSDPRIKTAKGPTILLHSGHYFDLLDPASSRFTLGDIAQGLANTCRFTGQCRRFYSVAEHSWHASFLVPERFQLAALMHDAAEAFIGDVTRPLKQLLPEYRAIEKRIEAVIAERFKLGRDCDDPVVKHADMQMLAAEQKALMPATGGEWAMLANISVPTIKFRHWSTIEGSERWLHRYSVLTGSMVVSDLEWAL